MNFKTLIQTLFPESCIACKRFLGKNEKTLLCAACIDSLQPKIIRTIEPFPVISLFEYEHPVIKTVLAAIKFHSNLRIAKEFPQELLKKIQSHAIATRYLQGNNTLYIPIPIHYKRLKQRGFNQVDYLFKPLAAQFNIPYIPAIKRCKETQALFGLNPEQRHTMMLDAFELDPEHCSTIKGKHVLIVDDILTTGSTIQEAAKLLQNAGVKSILGFTLAKANL